jgi:RNA polymerase primary sigma factor
MVNSKSKKVFLSGSQKPYLERDNSLNILYSEIRPYTPLTQEETKELFLQYHNGDESEKKFAFEKICKHNLRLVISLARDYCSSEDSLNDLIQEGNIGLMKAIELFDVNNGTPFHGYAMYWIRRYINIFKTNTTPIVAQTNRSKTANVIISITSKLWQKLERIPTPDEILEIYNEAYPHKPIRDTKDLVNVEYVYISEPESNAKEERDLQGFLDYNEKSLTHNAYLVEIDKEENKAVINRFLKLLTPNEHKAISMMYGLNGTIKTNSSVIATEMGITPQRVSQLCSSAITKMKKNKEAIVASFR